MKSIVTIKKSDVKGSESGIKKKRLRSMGHLNIDETQLPEIKDWQVGEEYEITIKVRQTAMKEADKWQTEEYGLPEKSIIADFEILSAKTGKTEDSKEYKK